MSAMNTEFSLTTAGMPAIVLEGVRYPLMFSIGAIKEWSEHQGITFQAAIEQGWVGDKLSLEETECLLRIALRHLRLNLVGHIRRRDVRGRGSRR